MLLLSAVILMVACMRNGILFSAAVRDFVALHVRHFRVVFAHLISHHVMHG